MEHHSEALAAEVMDEAALDELLSRLPRGAVFISNLGGCGAGPRRHPGDLLVGRLLAGFEQTSKHVDGDTGYVTWKADGIPFGTDTFVPARRQDRRADRRPPLQLSGLRSSDQRPAVRAGRRPWHPAVTTTTGGDVDDHDRSRVRPDVGGVLRRPVGGLPPPAMRRRLRLSTSATASTRSPLRGRAAHRDWQGFPSSSLRRRPEHAHAAPDMSSLRMIIMMDPPSTPGSGLS